MDQFFNEWKKRYKEGACTKEHIERLGVIGRLTAEQITEILAQEVDLPKGPIVPPKIAD